jgi:EAL domain-containing protein (putative c-di-GMP-specific phosphodiesterase class I)
VESAQEAKIMSGMSCQAAQGYHFARPMAEAKVIELLSNWQPKRVSA